MKELRIMQPIDIDSKPAGGAASALASFQSLSREISEKEFLRLRNLIHEEAGIWPNAFGITD
jgi:hypothetical protein